MTNDRARACSHSDPTTGFRCPLPALEASGGWGETWDGVCDLHDRHDPVTGSVRARLLAQYEAAHNAWRTGTGGTAS